MHLADSALHFGILYEGSALSQKALEQCLYLMKGKNCHLHICTCIDQPSTDPPFGYLPEEADQIVLERKKKVEEQVLAPLRLRLATEDHLASVSMDIEVGDPRSYMLQFVEKYEIQYLFLGSRGLSGLTGFLLGSTSQFAMHNCPCSVVIVK